MDDGEKLLNFLFRLKDIELKTREIAAQEIVANQTQGANQQILQAIIASEKQTLETIRLTRIITWLTIFLVVIGIIQILITLTKN
ncbi:MAG: hypothetical protein WC634_01925 [archaeon]